MSKTTMAILRQLTVRASVAVWLVLAAVSVPLVSCGGAKPAKTVDKDRIDHKAKEADQDNKR